MQKRMSDMFPARRDVLRLGGYGLLGAFADQALFVWTGRPANTALR